MTDGGERSARLARAEDGEHVVLADEDVILAVELDFVPAVLAEEHHVADLDVERAGLAILQDLAVAHRDDPTLDRLLLRGVGDDDPALGLALALEALDDDPILQRPDFHDWLLIFE